jgi:hypothetical protein
MDEILWAASNGGGEDPHSQRHREGVDHPWGPSLFLKMPLLSQRGELQYTVLIRIRGFTVVFWKVVVR